MPIVYLIEITGLRMKKVLTVFALLVLLNTVYAQNLEGKVEFKAAMEYYKQQKFLMSIGGFRNTLKLGHKTAEVYFYLGNALVASQSFEKAALQFKIALEMDVSPDFQSVLLFNLGNAYYRLQNYSNSIRYFEDAYNVSPDSVASFWLKGMAYYKLRDKTHTIQAWENYLSLAPNGPQSENIRKALALLKAEGFTFPGDPDKNNSDTNTEGDLVDIEGVLDKVELEDKGKAEDTELEDLEM